MLFYTSHTCRVQQGSVIALLAFSVILQSSPLNHPTRSTNQTHIPAYTNKNKIVCRVPKYIGIGIGIGLNACSYLWGSNPPLHL